jgi:hypothetical protein
MQLLHPRAPRGGGRAGARASFPVARCATGNPGGRTVVLDAAAVCSSGPGGDPVGAERIGEGTSVVEQTLGRPGCLRGHRGRRSATTSSAPNTSSGRTAGVVCRTTAVSIAQTSIPASTLPPALTCASTSARATSICRRPDGVTRSTTTASAASSADERRRRSSGRRRAARCATRSRRSARPADALGDRAGEHVQAVGQRGVQRAGELGRARPVGEPDLQVLGLAGRPGRRGTDPRQPRVRGEPVRVRRPGSPPGARPLHAAGDVTVRQEAQPPALGEPHADARHGGRCRVRRLTGPHARHGSEGSEARRGQSGTAVGSSTSNDSPAGKNPARR